MDEKFFKMMVDDYDQLLPIPREVYENVSPHIQQIRVKRGTVIKEMGTTDLESRYLCEGFVGSYILMEDELSLASIYGPSDIIFEETSLRAGMPSNTAFRAISDVVYLTIPRAKGIDLLNQHVPLIRLAHKVAQRITERFGCIHAISKMGISSGYEVLMQEFHGLEAVITHADLATFFGVHTRTVQRLKHKLKSQPHGKR